MKTTIFFILLFCTISSTASVPAEKTLSGKTTQDRKIKISFLYTDFPGTFFRTLPRQSHWFLSLQKTTPDKIAEQAEKGTLRLALTHRVLRSLPSSYRMVPFAAAGTILAVPPANPLRNISRVHARSILQDGVGNWKMLGGPALRLRLYVKASMDPRILSVDMRPHDHAKEKTVDSPRTIDEYRKFRRRLKGESSEQDAEKKEHKVLKMQTLSDEKTFSLLFVDPWGIGAFPLTRYDENRLKLLSVDSILPTLENFRKGTYPLMKTYYLIMHRDLSPEEKLILRHLEGRKFLAGLLQEGYLVYPPEKK